MTQKKLAGRLDWNEMLGFEQVVGSRDSMRAGAGQCLGAKVGVKPDLKPTIIRIGSKTGLKPTNIG